MRVLVTGAGGFAGRYLLQLLLEQEGIEVVACGTAPESTDQGDSAWLRAVRWVPLDVTDAGSIAEVVRDARPEQTYHLAGQSSVGLSFHDPIGTWDVNALGTVRLLSALQELGAGGKVLVISSAEVYGAVPASAQPIRESTPMRPISPYGASKAAAELAAQQVAMEGELEVVVARSFNHIGPGQDDRFVLPSMARQLAAIRRGEGEPRLRVGNLSVRRDFLDVRDVVRGYQRLMNRGVTGEVYNVCSGVSRELEEVVRRMVALAGGGVDLLVDPERFRSVDIPELTGDAGRLRSLGWAPQISLERTLRDLLGTYDGRALAGN